MGMVEEVLDFLFYIGMSDTLISLVNSNLTGAKLGNNSDPTMGR